MNHLRFQGASNTRMSVQQGSLIEDECRARRKGFQPTREEPSRLELVTSIGPTPTRQKVLVPSFAYAPLSFYRIPPMVYLSFE